MVGQLACRATAGADRANRNSISAVIRTSAWDGRDPATLAHMARSERVEYGFLYSEFTNNEVHRLDERAAWIELASFDGATLLDHQDQMRLQGLIFRARLRDSRIDANAGRFMKRAAAIGLKLAPEPDLAPYGPELCRPVLAPRLTVSGGPGSDSIPIKDGSRNMPGRSGKAAATRRRSAPRSTPRQRKPTK